MKQHRILIGVGLLGLIAVLSALFLTAQTDVQDKIIWKADSLSVQMIANNATVQITDDIIIQQLIDALHDTEFKEPLISENEAPDDLIAVVQMISESKSIGDIVVKGTGQESFRFYINTDVQLVPKDSNAVHEILKAVIYEGNLLLANQEPADIMDNTHTTTEILPPHITEVKKIIHTQMADVTHDGIDDVIETSITLPSDVEDKSLDALLKMTLPCDIAVYDTTLSTNKPIYEQSYGAPHTANGQLSLVEVDGLFYLLEGSLYAGQGSYTFAHSLFSLDSQGNRQVQAEDSAQGQLSDGDAASKIDTYFSNLTPWVERATAIAILDINLEHQMVSTEDETYLAKDYYQAMSAYYSEMTDEYALLG